MNLDDVQPHEVDQAPEIVIDNCGPTSGTRRLSLLLVLGAFSFVALVATNRFASGDTSAALTDYLNTRPGVEYVGDEVCRKCHLARYESFKRTGMGRSMCLPRVGDLGIPSTPITLRSENSGRVYSVYVKNGKLFHSETQLDSSNKPVFTETHEVAYSVGSGDHGRSYLIERGDFLFLSPLSFYTSKRKWDLSPGYESGLYRGFTRPSGNLCVSCHSGLAQPVPGTTNQYRQPMFPILAIGCERCHGPGAIHAAERRAATPVDTASDRSIVNPRNLSPRLRDDVCFQCHLAGDARVQRPGKNAFDFRPGTPLNDVVAVFLVPANLKIGGFQALSQPEQIQMSRCRKMDGTQLNCITCHDPHVQQSGVESAKYFDGKCVQCHATESRRFVVAHRSNKSLPGSCIACHMPRVQLTNIAHTSLTDHRIPKTPKDDLASRAGPDPDPLTNLIWATRPTDAGLPDLRTLALAFAQLAPNYPGYGERGFPLLERAAREFPNDPDLQSTYGEVLLIISPDFRERAKQALQRAMGAGSKSTSVRRRLAELLMEEGNPQGLGLLREAIQLEPYNASAYLQLARSYLQMGDRGEAAKTAKQVLSFDPGNSDARKLMHELP
jgi:hypothetical protein